MSCAPWGPSSLRGWRTRWRLKRSYGGPWPQRPPPFPHDWQGAFPFAGRSKESELLSGAWSAAASGGTQLVLLSGEPGIGKTRLSAELALAATEKGGLVLAGHCDELVGASYQPFAEALRHHLSQPGGAETLGPAAGELARLAPELGQVIPGLAAPLSADPDAERLRLFEAVHGWLAELASGQPVLLVLDDLHWADAGTLLLMRHLVVNQPVSQLLMLGTYRDTDLVRTHPLSAMLGELRRRAEVSRIALDGLDAGEVTELMTRAAGHDLAPDGTALALAVQAETGGNPFFVSEVLRHLAESGAIVQAGGRWSATSSPEERLLPEGIREVVGRRVNMLGEQTQQALSAAAVIGAEFGLAVLAAVSGRSDDELIDALESALAARLIVEAGVDRYRFAHALVRQTLHAELSTSRRARLHRLVAQALETLHASDLDAVITELAYHWGEAGPATAHDQAVAYARRAGELAERRLAPEEAARWYTQARELLDGADPRLDAELATRTAQAMALARMAGWRDAVHEAAEAAEALGDTALMAAALCINPRRVVAEGSPEAADPEKIELIERALARCSPGDRMLWAKLTGSLVAELVHTGDLERRIELTRQVNEYSHSLVDPDERWQAMLTVGPNRPWSSISRTDIEQWAGEARHAAGRAAARGDRDAEAQACRHRVGFLIWLGDPGYREALAELVAMLEGYPHPWFQDDLLVRLMMVANLEGRPREAERLAGTLRAQMASHGSLEGPILSSGGMLAAARETVGLEPLIPILQSSSMNTESKPNAIQAILSVALSEAGRLDETRVVLEERGGHDFSDVPDDAALPVADSHWAEAAVLCADERVCRIFYARLLPFADMHQATGNWYLGGTARYLGLLSDALGRADEADEWFAKAEAQHAGIQSPPWLARGLLDWAESRQRRGQQDGVRALATKALDAVGDLELKVSRARAERILQS
jgi:hypothetical protein